MTRSTGYHRLDVDGTTFWFGTEDAKLRLDGIEAMLAEMGNLGTGWGGQALFSDGTGLRDAHVVYGWLDEWADRALTAVETILAAPRSRNERTQKLSRKGGSGVLTAPTLRLLRSSPRQYLAANDNGLMEIGTERYDPLRVVVRQRSSTLRTIANGRAVSLLSWITRLATEVVDSDPSTTVLTRCRLWANRASTLARRPLAHSFSATTLTSYGSYPRQSEELLEAPYRATYAAAADIARLFGWSANIRPMSRYSYVAKSDSIYQAYTATRLAKSLGLQQTDPVLGSRPLAFTGPLFDLYYDTTCPADVLKSWRSSSTRPDDSRPDLLLYERSSGRVAVIDAKYRQAKDGGASEDSRKEVTSYLGLYGLASVSILFPGDTEPVAVSGHDRTIYEIPVRPAGDSLDVALPLILDSMEVPPY
ncbi:hypothetical protein [Rhodococcus sp. 06-156-3C]|nr:MULTISPECIES: hypothetical protein [unclassified Rhodococcus (in: high G+C Gram-positive bacteria)]